MASLTCFNRRFTPDWRMALLSFFVFALFLRLGFWQIERAAEKKQMISEQSELGQQPALNWQAGSVTPKQYQPLAVQGRYLAELFLLDNQHYQHQVGYQVLSPLLLATGQVLLVDRGWVAAQPNRQDLPKLDTLEGQVEVRGYAYYPSKKTWVLGPDYEQKEEKFWLLERIDTNLVEQFLHKSVYPFIIRLGSNEAGGYVREWAVVAMPPERHYAYALQWFAMASVILILFIVLNLKKPYENA